MSIPSKIITVLLLVTASFAGAQGFAVTSPAISGSSEKGYDSGLVSAGRLDDQYAAKADGPANPRSFPLSWSNVPPGTKDLALVLDDPDARLVLASRGINAPAFLHWTVTDIDPALGGLAANASVEMTALVQGKNGAGQIGYRGPQPPADFPPNTGKRLIHIYRLALYALSARTGLPKGYTLDQLRSALKDKVLGEAQLNLSYSND
jgi:hypothetical protein